jgi:hypothetical protein
MGDLQSKGARNAERNVHSPYVDEKIEAMERLCGWKEHVDEIERASDRGEPESWLGLLALGGVRRGVVGEPIFSEKFTFS